MLFVTALILLVPAVDMARAVGGISNSKVVVPSAETVPKGKFEIEPFFGLEIVDDRENTTRFGGGVRFTLGALHNLEIGANINYLDFEDSDLIQRNSDFSDIEMSLNTGSWTRARIFPSHSLIRAG